MVCIAETFHIIDPELHGFAAIDKTFQLAISKAGLKLKVFIQNAIMAPISDGNVSNMDFFVTFQSDMNETRRGGGH